MSEGPKRAYLYSFRVRLALVVIGLIGWAIVIGDIAYRYHRRPPEPPPTHAAPDQAKNSKNPRLD